MAFTKVFDNTKPVGSVTAVKDLDTFLQDLAYAIMERVNSIGGVATDWNAATDPLKWEKLNLNGTATTKLLIGTTELLFRDDADGFTLLQVKKTGVGTGEVIFPLDLKLLGNVTASFRHTAGQATTH